MTSRTIEIAFKRDDQQWPESNEPAIRYRLVALENALSIQTDGKLFRVGDLLNEAQAQSFLDSDTYSVSVIS